MTIRKISLAELEKVKLMEERCFPSNHYNGKEMEEMYQNPRYEYWGVWDKGSMAGYLILLDSIDIYEVIKIAVVEEARGKRLAEELFVKANETLDKDVMLEVREGNRSAIRLYEKLGFENIGKRKNYYRDTMEDALIMLLTNQQ